MGDPERSIDILQRVSEDEVLRRDRRDGLEHACPIGRSAAGEDLDQKDLLLSVAIGLSNAALSRRFLIDRLTAAQIRQTLEVKYAKLFTWLATYRSEALNQGFVYHDGKRKYLEGLKSSDIDKRHKALVSAVRWLISY